MTTRSAARAITILMLTLLVCTVMTAAPANADVTSSLTHLYKHLNKVYVRNVAKPGTVMTGYLSERYYVNTGFLLAVGSYPSRLATGTPAPELEYVDNYVFTETCPGFGQAASGVLCVYALNNSNIDGISTSGGWTDEPARYFGFSLDVFPSGTASSGFFIAAWAYTVPPVSLPTVREIPQRAERLGIGSR